MKSLNKIAEVADKFEQKLHKIAVTSAQAGDIEATLKSAGAWVDPNAISPLLDKAGVPGDVSLNIGIAVDAKLNVKFIVQSTPVHPSAQKLAALLTQTFAGRMSQALKAANLSVSDTITAKVATF